MEKTGEEAGMGIFFGGGGQGKGVYSVFTCVILEK